MRLISSVIAVGIFFLLISCSSKKVLTNDYISQEKYEITRVMKQQEGAWNNGDIDEFMEAYWKSDSLRFISGDKVNYGWNDTRASYKRGYPDNQVWAFYHLI